MCPLAFSAGGGDPDGPGPGGGVGEPACGGKGGGREEEEEDEEEEEEEDEDEDEEEDEEEERHHSPVPVCACGPGNRRRPGLAPKRGSVTRSGACVLCRGPADRTGRGKDGASRTEHCSPVVETGVCPTGRGFGSRCDVRKQWPLKRAHAGAAAVQREISSGSSCPSNSRGVRSGRPAGRAAGRPGRAPATAPARRQTAGACGPGGRRAGRLVDPAGPPPPRRPGGREPGRAFRAAGRPGGWSTRKGPRHLPGPAAESRAGRLVDPPRRGRRGERKGHADARVPSSLSPPAGTGQRDGTRARTRASAATGSRRRPPGPARPPRARGPRGRPATAPDSRPRHASPPVPRPSPRARTRGGEAEEGARHPEAGRRRQGRPPSSPLLPRRPPPAPRRTAVPPRPRPGPGAEDTPPPARGEAEPPRREERERERATPARPERQTLVGRPPFRPRPGSRDGGLSAPDPGPDARRGRAAPRPPRGGERGRRPAGGDGGGPAIRGRPRLPRRCRIVPPGRDSDLEAFSHNPTDGSFAPLAPQPSTYTKCLNLRFLSY
ncbi:hypothetical protein ABFV05_000814 [Capra hircus]